MAERNETIEALLKGMESYITTKTTVGEPIKIGDTIILPLADVSFGMGLGAFSKDANNAGGMGGKLKPAAVLIIKDGMSKVVSVNSQDSMTKILDMVPDIVDKFTSKEDDITVE
ncbi:MAG: GerW family sporulation protein [Lachnospiraceae bacterium]|nr:GerW family sporulation protein [Lachnospiraceae bacterium]